MSEVLAEDIITEAAVASFAGCADERLRTIMSSLVRHLHAFGRDVKLTQAEWFKAIDFLTAVGHITDEKRQEFVLLSDTLGLSMLVVALNDHKPAGCTESTVFGPFYVEGAPEFANGADIAGDAKGEPCWVHGTVRDINGHPVPGATIDVWQCDEAGLYDVQYPDLSEYRVRGRFTSLADGRFHFKSVLAVSYPIPHDGPVGQMLAATGRHPWRPAHVHFMISAPGCEPLITHVFRQGDKYLHSDAVFGVRSTLIADWIRHPPGPAPDGTVSQVPYYVLGFDFVLARA